MYVMYVHKATPFRIITSSNTSICSVSLPYVDWIYVTQCTLCMSTISTIILSYVHWILSTQWTVCRTTILTIILSNVNRILSTQRTSCTTATSNIIESSSSYTATSTVVLPRLDNHFLRKFRSYDCTATSISFSYLRLIDFRNTASKFGTTTSISFP